MDAIRPKRRGNGSGSIARKFDALGRTASDRLADRPGGGAVGQGDLRREELRGKISVIMSESKALLRLIEKIQSSKRHIEQIIGEHIDQPSARLVGGFSPGRCREIPQHTKSTFADDPIGYLSHDAKHAGDTAAVVIDRTVGEG